MMLKKWCVRLLLLSSFFSGLAIYYVVIENIEESLIFFGVDDD